jgi:benzoyl-CoA reductase/2-hydroxyglutaryl-CoA dehydratase subunit BcrC/BadD/HgdB
MITEQEFGERLTRLEQEVDALKQQLSMLAAPNAPIAALDLLEHLWQVGGLTRTSLTLAEARQQLAEGLPNRWGSQQIKRLRSRR